MTGQCCVVTRRDLHAAHERVGELERMVTVLNATIANLTEQLATISLDRDNWRREHAKAVTRHAREKRAA